MLSEEYIDLCRTFHELTLKDGAADEFDFQHLRHGKSLSWSDLLARHRTVILSEAGSGKTEEIRQTATSLRREGISNAPFGRSGLGFLRRFNVHISCLQAGVRLGVR